MNPSDLPQAMSAPVAEAGEQIALAVPGGAKRRQTRLIVVAAVASFWSRVESSPHCC